MRSIVTGLAALGLAASVTGCAVSNEAARSAVAGGLMGAGIGAGLGATLALNPGLGAAVGAAGGGLLGAASGALAAPPPITYGAIPPQDAAFAPGFYDTWPPGYDDRPVGAAAAPRPG